MMASDSNLAIGNTRGSFLKSKSAIYGSFAGDVNGERDSGVLSNVHINAATMHGLPLGKADGVCKYNSIVQTKSSTANAAQMPSLDVKN